MSEPTVGAFTCAGSCDRPIDSSPGASQAAAAPASAADTTIDSRRPTAGRMRLVAPTATRCDEAGHDQRGSRHDEEVHLVRTVRAGGAARDERWCCSRSVRREARARARAPRAAASGSAAHRSSSTTSTASTTISSTTSSGAGASTTSVGSTTISSTGSGSGAWLGGERRGRLGRRLVGGRGLGDPGSRPGLVGLGRDRLGQDCGHRRVGRGRGTLGPRRAAAAGPRGRGVHRQWSRTAAAWARRSSAPGCRSRLPARPRRPGPCRARAPGRGG